MNACQYTALRTKLTVHVIHLQNLCARITAYSLYISIQNIL